MSMLFRSITATLICSLCPLIYISSSVDLITSLFLVLFTLNTSNEISAGFFLILSSLTNCLSILVWAYPKSTSFYSHNSFLFCVLILACMFSSFFFVVLLVWDNISIMSLSYISSLYYIYSELSPKLHSLSLFSVSRSSWTLWFFIFCPN